MINSPRHIQTILHLKRVIDCITSNWLNFTLSSELQLANFPVVEHHCRFEMIQFGLEVKLSFLTLYELELFINFQILYWFIRKKHLACIFIDQNWIKILKIALPGNCRSKLNKPWECVHTTTQFAGHCLIGHFYFSAK